MAAEASTAEPSDRVAVNAPASPPNSCTVQPVADIDRGVAFDPRDHAADGVLRPFPGRHEFGVAGQDRRAAKPVLLLDKHGIPADAGQGLGCGEPGRAAADHEDRLGHAPVSETWDSIRLKPGPEVIIRRGS